MNSDTVYLQMQDIRDTVLSLCKVKCDEEKHYVTGGTGQEIDNRIATLKVYSKVVAGPLAGHPDACAILVEQDGNGHERACEKPKERARPADAEIDIHGSREERERSAKHGTNEIISGENTRGVSRICVREVIQDGVLAGKKSKNVSALIGIQGRKVQLTKRSRAAMLKRLEPMMGTIQCTLSRDDHPNQKREMGTSNAPTIATGMRSSGLSSPFSLYFGSCT